MASFLLVLTIESDECDSLINASTLPLQWPQTVS